MKIYISGPMRGYTHYNADAFDEAETKLARHGHTVINPVSLDCAQGFDPWEDRDNYDSTPDGFDLRTTILTDVVQLLSCDAVYMLTGWRKSRGARAERAVAVWAGLDVMND